MPHADSDNSSDINVEQVHTKNTKKQSKKITKYLLFQSVYSTTKVTKDVVDQNLWCDVDKVIKTVQLIQQDTASKHGKLDEDNAARGVHEESLRRLSSESKEHTTRTYYKIIQIVPSLKAIIDDPLKSTELMVISSKMNVMIRSTRSNNATRLKTYIPQYAAPNPFKVAFNPPIVSSNGRTEMGLNHPILTRWLCPADQLQRFDEDPIQAVKDLASDVISMGAEDFPTLFWSGSMPGDDCLFKSYFLVRVSQWSAYIKTAFDDLNLGPSSALGGDSRATRSCNAILHNMTTVEPEHVAYICMQACFRISSKSQWSEVDEELNYYAMYRGIVSFIRDAPDTAWRDELLKWWNKELFSDENGHGNSKKKTEGTSLTWMSMMERMHAQMKACLAEQSLKTVVMHHSATSLVMSTRSTPPTPTISLAPITPLACTTLATCITPAIPTTPLTHTTPVVHKTPTPHGSPLTEPEETVLTSLMNKKVKLKSMKEKGKKRAAASEEVEGNVAEEPTRILKRHHR
ncbi:hypothetical protein F5I97DRAFT_2000613 [Phlebopus sp. FC_14]|nr:hypothetical protein F5I97DRAFT_2000613 [Phlebopus sp. FC_14]